MGAHRRSSDGERDPCDDTGPIPALPHGDLDRNDDLHDSGEGEADDLDEDDVAPAFDELAAELDETVDDDEPDSRTGAQGVARPVSLGPGDTTRVDPLAETGDPDALPVGRGTTERMEEAVTASGETDRVATPDTTAAVAGLPAGLPPDTPARTVATAPDERRAPPRADLPTPAKVRALTALAAALPLLVVLLLVALGVPQTLVGRWSGRDRLEPNDAFDEARALGVGLTEELSCGGSDVDWFALEVPPGQALVVTVTPAPLGQGGASLHTTDGRRVAVVGPRDSRLVHLSPGPDPQALRLCVWGARPDYDVSIAYVAPDARFEPNDAALGAAPISPGRVGGLRCNGEDWFRVAIPAHHAARATLVGAAPGLTLGWASGGVAPVTSGREVGARPAPLDRVALLRVSGAGAYDLAVDVEPRVADEAGQRLEPGEYPRLVCSSQDEWRIDVAEGQVLEVTMREPRDSWNLNAELLDTSWQDLPASGSHTVEDGAGVTRLTYTARRDEEVILRVSGPPIEYGVEVWIGAASAPTTAAPAPSTAPNPTGARAIGPGVYPDQVVSGEAWYALEAAEGQRVSVTAEFTHASGDIDLELFDDLGRSLTAANGRVDVEQLEHVTARAGRLLLRVSTYARMQPFALTVAYDGSAAPTALAEGRHAGLECAGNAFFGVTVPGGRRLVVEIGFRSAEGDLDLQLLGPGGELLARSESLEDRERIEYVAAVDEALTLRVYNARNRFDAEVRLEEP